MPLLRLFISHAHEDKPLAKAVKRLISTVFPAGDAQTVKVDYSSDESPEAGPRAGSHWLEWILDVVRETDVCIVIVSADSVSAPWLMWETGAVTGVAVSTPLPKERSGRVVPFLFGVDVDSIPAPLKHLQAVNGQQEREVLRLLYGLHRDAGAAGPFPSKVAERATALFVRHARQATDTRTLARPLELQLREQWPLHFVSCCFGLALQPDEGRIRNSQRLVCVPLNGEAYQGWRLQPVQRGIYQVLTIDGSHCVSVDGDRITPNAPLMLWQYTGEHTQHWRLEVFPGTSTAPGTVRIVNNASHLCLAAWPSAQDIVQVEIENHSNEDWWILVAPPLRPA